MSAPPSSSAPEFPDLETLVARSSDWSPRVAIALATRAVLRVAPFSRSNRGRLPSSWIARHLLPLFGAIDAGWWYAAESTSTRNLGLKPSMPDELRVASARAASSNAYAAARAADAAAFLASALLAPQPRELLAFAAQALDAARRAAEAGGDASQDADPSQLPALKDAVLRAMLEDLRVAGIEGVNDATLVGRLLGAPLVDAPALARWREHAAGWLDASNAPGSRAAPDEAKQLAELASRLARNAGIPWPTAATSAAADPAGETRASSPPSFAGRTAVFLGAGASKAFGYPLSGELLPRILDAIDRGVLFRTANSEKENEVDRAWFAARLFEFVPGLRDAWNRSRDPRALGMSAKNLLAQVDHAIERKEARAGMGPEELARFRGLLVRAIYEAVLHDSDRRKGPQQRVLDAFTAWLQRLEKPVTLVTSNFDSAVDQRIFALLGQEGTKDSEHRLGPKVDLGFTWRAVESGELVRRPPNPDWRLYKLNGSVNWLRCPRCGYIYMNPHGAVGSKAFENHRNSWNTCHCAEDAKLQLCLATYSVEEIEGDPHIRELWQAAEQGLQEAERWIIIGHSFSPDDVAVRSLFQRAWDRHRLPGKPQVEVVIRRQDLQAGSAYRAFFPAKNLTFHPTGLEGFLVETGLLRETDVEDALETSGGSPKPGASVPPADVAAALARLAFVQPAALHLAATPTVEGFATALTGRFGEGKVPADWSAELARATDDLAPDPLWLAWIQTVHAPALDAIGRWQAPRAAGVEVALPGLPKTGLQQAMEQLRRLFTEDSEIHARLAREHPELLKQLDDLIAGPPPAVTRPPGLPAPASRPASAPAKPRPATTTAADLLRRLSPIITQITGTGDMREVMTKRYPQLAEQIAALPEDLFAPGETARPAPESPAPSKSGPARKRAGRPQQKGGTSGFSPPPEAPPPVA